MTPYSLQYIVHYLWPGPIGNKATIWDTAYAFSGVQIINRIAHQQQCFRGCNNAKTNWLPPLICLNGKSLVFWEIHMSKWHHLLCHFLHSACQNVSQFCYGKVECGCVSYLFQGTGNLSSERVTFNFLSIKFVKPHEQKMTSYSLRGQIQCTLKQIASPVCYQFRLGTGGMICWM
jgi:hypothetical protein